MAPQNFDRFSSASALKTYLLEDAIVRYGDLFGQDSKNIGYGYPYYYESALLSGADGSVAVDAVVPVADTVPTPVAAPSPGTSQIPADSPGSASKDFSTTNTQVEGVDEADLVETDGEFIYQVNDQLLTIVDARNDSQLSIAAQFSLAPFFDDDPLQPPQFSNADLRVGIATMPTWSSINGMYLWGDRLTVIASGYSSTANTTATGNVWPVEPYWGDWGTPTVQVTVFDVADPTDVSVVETSTLEGSLVTSRAIAEDVFVVTSSDFRLPAPQIITDDTAGDTISGDSIGDGATTDSASLLPPYGYPEGTYETESAYLTRIDGQELDLAMPNIATVDSNGQLVASGLLTDPINVYQPLDTEPWQLTTVSTFELGNDQLGVDASTSIPTDWVGNVFVSRNSIYLFKEKYRNNTTDTEILQVDLATGALIARGEVPGYVDNQFSADEYNGFLRLSTTSGFGNRSSNNIYVLEKNGTNLNIVGRVENLARGEQIYSTRFQGDYGFVVTFRQVDPLFTLDLQDPGNPKVLGELKIPGFSEYLQVIEQGDRTLLLGVGQDADPETGIAGNLKISLFDVTDLSNPEEIDSYIFPGNFTGSDALWDHRAITYSPSQKLLAIPSQTYDPVDFRLRTTLDVFRVDAKRGVKSLGSITHGEEAWINRSLYIENTLYAVSPQQISAHQIPDFEDLSNVAWSGQGVGLVITAPLSGGKIRAGERDDKVLGGPAVDILSGGDGLDRMRGNGGNDVMRGDGGDDTLFGNRGHDHLRGNAGDDVLYGGRGSDRLLGGKDDDALVGGGGRDYLHGGPGGADTLSGGGGGDRFIFQSTRSSLLKNYDRITDLVIGTDRIEGPYAIAAEQVLNLGKISTLAPTDIRSILNRKTFKAKQAATFKVAQQTFLSINNGQNGFQRTRDSLIEITGFTGDLAALEIS